MSAEELDTAIERLKVQAKPGKWRNDVISAIGSDVRAVLNEVERLRKVVEDAPHADDCRAFPQFAALLGIAARPCTCWKASAVGTKAPEEPKTFEEHFVCVKADNIVYAQGFCYCQKPDSGPHSITLDRKKPTVGTNNEEGN